MGNSPLNFFRISKIPHTHTPNHGTGNWMGSWIPSTSLENEQLFFPTCQVRVVRFYVSLSFSSSFSSSSFSSSSSSSPPLLLSCAGPQRRSCVCSVPRRTSTAILCVQCSAPDLNCDPVSAVFRAGPQPRSCECRVPRRTSTAIL